MDTEKDYSEDDKKEVVVITVKGKKATIAADFDRLRKAHGMLTKTKMVGKNVDVEMDMIAPGDHLLFFCKVDEATDMDILKRPALRMLAATKLTSWLTDLMSDEDESEEKKS